MQARLRLQVYVIRLMNYQEHTAFFVECAISFVTVQISIFGKTNKHLTHLRGGALRILNLRNIIETIFAHKGDLESYLALIRPGELEVRLLLPYDYSSIRVLHPIALR